MKVRFAEVAALEAQGSIGANYIFETVRNAGYDVSRTSPEAEGRWDVELLSLHHCTDFPRLARLPRRASIRIIGGYPLASNPRPVVPFADVICLGEGETWILSALDLAKKGASLVEYSQLPGTIVPEFWDGKIPNANAESIVPKHPPYLNVASEGHKRTWYLELARGCPFMCAFCTLGHGVPYRIQDTSWILSLLGKIDTSKSKRVTLFAPDEASHPGYTEILRKIHKLKLITSFGSMRLDQIIKKDLPFKKNMLIRVGIDGLSERLRFNVGKKITNKQIVQYFRHLSGKGHVSFKIFQIFGLPGETMADWEEWKLIWSHIAAIPRLTNAHVRIKFTPFIPQPGTPLGKAIGRYDQGMANRVAEWMARNAKPHRHPGWYLKSDGVMSARSYDEQVKLVVGNEKVLTSM